MAEVRKNNKHIMNTQTKLLTLSIIKPDAMHKKHAGSIITMIEQAGFSIKSILTTQLTWKLSERFYQAHSTKPFYPLLCEFISSGPIIAMVLQKENAIPDLRTLMGSTNPAEAADGTIRKAYGSTIMENAIHGSDSEESAAAEIAFFFPQISII